MLEVRRAQAKDTPQERHYQGSMCRFPIALHPTLKQMVLWNARVTHQLRCTSGWVHIHAETLERFYRATMAHATQCFITHSLKEWRKQIRQKVQV